MLTKRAPVLVPASVPDGERVYAVGDIHGRADLLADILRMIEHYDSVRAPASVTIVFLGDYIDRGADSKGVIDLLISGIPAEMSAVYLTGNHEDLMLASFNDTGAFRSWTANGGIAALASYGVNPDLLQGRFLGGLPPANAPAIMEQLDSLLPHEHITFFRNMQVFTTIGDYFFVHAGVRPGLPLEKQTREEYLYIRHEFLQHNGDLGKVVVHGHTPSPRPELRPNRIGIDTLAYRTGRLTALCLEGAERSFLVT